MASKFSSANPSGSITLWQPAQAGFVRCCFHALAQRRWLCPDSALVLSAGTLGGGGGRRSAQNIGQNPFAALHRAKSGSAYEVTVRMLPCPSRPRRFVVGQRHAAETGRRRSVRNPVMPRQPLVDERVIGVQQIQHAAVFAHDALEEQLRLAAHGLAQVVVEIGKVSKSGLIVLQIAQEQPLAGEIVDQRVERADRPACASPAAPARPDLSACRRWRCRAALRRECCSTGRTKAATPVRDR